MNFEQFRAKVKEAMPEFLPEELRDSTIRDAKVDKLQIGEVRGILITPPGSNIGVNVYLEEAFDEYLSGKQFTAIMNRVADTAVGSIGETKGYDYRFLQNYSLVKRMITMQAINRERNEATLRNVPHRIMEDLAIVYRFDLGSGTDGRLLALITNDMLKAYGITPDQLHTDALEAAKSTMKYSILSMNEVLERIQVETFGRIVERPVGWNPMHVATTENSCFGAGIIAIPDFLEDAAEKMHGDFYVLPSSIHEIILIPSNCGVDASELREMVCDVNTAEVSEEEKLSDNVYFYSAVDHSFKIAGE